MTTYRCVCGDSYNTYPVIGTCSSCSINSQTVTKTERTGGILSYVDSDQGLGAAIFEPVYIYVTYTNNYNHPAANYPMQSYYNYPLFASFSSSVESATEGQAAYVPNIVSTSYPEAKYYNNSGSLLATQSLTWTLDYNAIAYYTFTIYGSNPSYVNTRATCNIDGFASSLTGYNTAYFS